MFTENPITSIIYYKQCFYTLKDVELDHNTILRWMFVHSIQEVSELTRYGQYFVELTKKNWI